MNYPNDHNGDNVNHQESKEIQSNEANVENAEDVLSKDAQRRVFDEATGFVDGMVVPDTTDVNIQKVEAPSVDNTELDAMEAELANNQKVQQSLSTGAFSVTPMDYDPEKEKEKREKAAFVEKINDYGERALQLNVNPKVIKQVQEEATPETVSNFKDFMMLINQCAQMQVSANKRSEDELYFAQLKAQQDIERLKKLPNLGEVLNKSIVDKYNTTAVTSFDLLKMVTADGFDQDVLELGIFQKPIYSLILNIDEDWFKELVESILIRWEDNEAAEEIVEKYIASLRGGSLDGCDLDAEKKALINVLPENIKNENSPDLYKAYKAIQIIQGSGGKEDDYTSDEFSEKLMANADIGIDFAADVNVAMDDGDPFYAATNSAATTAADKMKINEQIAGKVVSRFIDSTQRKAVKTGMIDEYVKGCISEETYAEYQNAKELRDNMAMQRREQKAVEREEKRVRKQDKAEIKHQKQMDKLDREIERANKERELAEAQAAIRAAQPQQQPQPQPQPVQQQYQQTYGNQYRRGYGNQYGSPYGGGYYGNQNGYGRGGFFMGQNRYGGVNYGSQRIPFTLIVVVLNIILGLLGYILLKGLFLILALVGLGITFVGVYKKCIQERGWQLVLIGGYVLFLVTIVLNFMR